MYNADPLKGVSPEAAPHVRGAVRALLRVREGGAERGPGRDGRLQPLERGDAHVLFVILCMYTCIHARIHVLYVCMYVCMYVCILCIHT